MKRSCDDDIQESLLFQSLSLQRTLDAKAPHRTQTVRAEGGGTPTPAPLLLPHPPAGRWSLPPWFPAGLFVFVITGVQAGPASPLLFLSLPGFIKTTAGWTQDRSSWIPGLFLVSMAGVFYGARAWSLIGRLGSRMSSEITDLYLEL